MSHPFMFSNYDNSSKYLVQFKAGKMTVKGNLVTPIDRKGLIFLRQTADMLMHFCWQDRQTGVTEDDLILFPEDAEFKRVPQCTTGRVYVLKFKSSSRRCFYWMQEPNEDNDEEFCKKINEYLNNPPLVARSSGNSGVSSRLGAALGSLGNLAEMGSIADSDIHNFMNNPRQLVQMLEAMHNASVLNQGNSGSSSGLTGTRTRHSGVTNVTSAQTTTSTPTETSQSDKTSIPSLPSIPSMTLERPHRHIEPSDLQSILSVFNVPKERPKEKPYLRSILKNETLQSLFANERFMNGVAAMLPPTESEGEKIPLTEQLSSTIQSPQFQQAFSKFSMALESGQLGPLLQQFGFSPACVDAANNGDLELFFKTLQEEEKNKKEKKNDDDNEMVLD